MRNPLGYKVLRTFQQGEEVYELTKKFTACYLHPIADSRLIGHLNDSARSVPRNIAEGYGRNNTKQYLEFMGFSFGSLLELLEDCFALEKDIKGGQRKTKDDDGAIRELSKIIKLCMGEKTMLKSQMERMEEMAGEQGLLSHRQKLARIMENKIRKEKEFNKWLKDQTNKK
ncbi:MAG: four helix bundle protein [Candidatus Berkelbacteria bacterium]|nr:four helix bundle protein [Candidatus Berkelbacteria bacterium]